MDPSASALTADTCVTGAASEIGDLQLDFKAVLLDIRKEV